MYENARDVLTAWLEAVNSGNLEQVLSMYSPNCVLLPTFSNKLHGDAAGRRVYFERLAGYDALSVGLRERTVVGQHIAGSIHSLSGIYSWHFELDGENLSFEARFTFTVDLSREDPIVHHHSSRVPEMLR